MIDIRLVREDPEAVRAAFARRGPDTCDVDALAELDRTARRLTARRDELRAQLRSLSAEVAARRRSGDVQGAEELAKRAREKGDEEKEATSAARQAEEALQQSLLLLPNLPSPDCPDGFSSEDNIIVRVHPSEPPTYADWQRVPHWDIGTQLGILDLERGAKLSGSMFPLYRGAGAALLRALTAFALDQHADAFEEIRPPTLVKTETMVSTGHLPKFAEEAYHMERDDLWAIPTAEVPLTSMARGEILQEDDLPIRLTASTACFRREAGAAGRDTRGLLRVHEFDKVELFAYTTPDQASEVHEDMVRRAEKILADLGLYYRVVDLCAGDLGASAARTFDLEAYAPGCDRWLEVSSVSWCSDYQARRANIRYRQKGQKGTAFVHTLNGSALAWARIWAAVVETHRQPDGSVVLPECLEPYIRERTIAPPR